MRIHTLKLFAILSLILLSVSGHATKTIILLGSPGSGKGTQSERIAKAFDLPILSFGNIFRDEEVQNSDIHLRKMAAGSDAILRNQLQLELFLEREHQGLYSKGAIFDSWPKEVASLRGLAAFFASDQPLVIELVVPQEIALQRSISRIICPSIACGVSYGSIRPAKVQGSCDHCGTPLLKRDHDNANDFPHRLKRYFEKREGVLNLYQKQGITVYQIDANRDPNLIANDISALIVDYLEKDHALAE